jgi:hypothetical protein
VTPVSALRQVVSSIPVDSIGGSSIFDGLDDELGDGFRCDEVGLTAATAFPALIAVPVDSVRILYRTVVA